VRGARWLIALAALALIVCPAPAAAQKPTAERPTYALGEKWIRTDGVWSLARVEKDAYVFVTSDWRAGEIRLGKDLSPVRETWGSHVDWEIDPPLPITWPLEVGKWRRGTVTLRTIEFPNGVLVNLLWRVEAYEDVKVPAGTFKAFRIVYTAEGRGDDPAAPRFTDRTLSALWYAPEARQFVQGEAGGLPLRFQIVAVDRPDAAPLRIAIDYPREQARLATDAVTLTGTVAAGKGITHLSVTVNGTEISTEAQRTPRLDLLFNLTVQLNEGKNVILVTATDAVGDTRQEVRTVFFERPPPATAHPAPAPAAPAGSAPAAPMPTPPAPAPAPAVARPAESPPSLAPPTPPPPPPAPTAAALPPFQVEVSVPRDQMRTEQESVALAGVVSGGRGVRRVLVTVNGVEISRREESTPQSSVAVNLPLRLREGQNTLVVTASDVDGRTQQEVRTVHYDKRVPLGLNVRFPEDRARLADQTTVVAALVTSSKGVTQVTVTLNGAEVLRQSEPAPPKSLAVTVPVTLREGANAIVVTATEADGTVKQEIRTVIYDRPERPTPPAPALAPGRWAVIIGIGAYDSPDIGSLRYTVPDADAMYQVLTGPGGFKKEQVILMTDRTERKPTIRNVRWALGTFLARSARKDDTVVIFFAGHGAPEVDQRGLERDGLAKYLAPSDADPEDLFSTALAMDDMQTILGRIEAERVVVFLDACYSGAAGGRTFASKKTRVTRLDDLFLERLTRSKGRAIITASRASEVSLELPELGHGIFTYYLVEGLKGAADGNRDGIVSLQELYEYLDQQVTQKARAVGGNQHPVMKGELEGALPLIKVR